LQEGTNRVYSKPVAPEEVKTDAAKKVVEVTIGGRKYTRQVEGKAYSGTVESVVRAMEDVTKDWDKYSVAKGQTCHVAQELTRKKLGIF
jgi:hypothetical protein